MYEGRYVMERLARAVRLAAKLREESFDKKGYEEAIEERRKENFDRKGYQKAIEKRPNRIVDSENYYGLTLQESADKAAEHVGFDTRGSLPVYLLLQYTWNDILAWAEDKFTS